MPAMVCAEELSCGIPLARHVERGETHSYVFVAAPGKKVVFNAVDTSGEIELVKLSEANAGETCSGELAIVSDGSPITVKASGCIDGTGGDYTITAQIVSDPPAECLAADICLPAAAEERLTIPGEIDAHTFVAGKGQFLAVETKGLLRYRTRIFAPSGAQVRADSCESVVAIIPPETGTYTILTSSCGSPQIGGYTILAGGGSCEPLPIVTYFGLADRDGRRIEPVNGREYYLNEGSGFSLVVEGRPGSRQVPLGTLAFRYDRFDATVRPDLQLRASLPLGAGSPAVCDVPPQGTGGVPGVFFSQGAREDADALNDFGCLVDDGTGAHLARPAEGPCTVDASGSPRLVAPDSTLQFCAPINAVSSLRSGSRTGLGAKVRDRLGTLSEEAVLYISVGLTPPPTRPVSPTATPTRTSTPTLPPSFTPTARQCAGDCDHSGDVALAEIVRAVELALANDSLSLCPPADANHDGTVTIEDVVATIAQSAPFCGRP